VSSVASGCSFQRRRASLCRLPEHERSNRRSGTPCKTQHRHGLPRHQPAGCSAPELHRALLVHHGVERLVVKDLDGLLVQEDRGSVPRARRRLRRALFAEVKSAAGNGKRDAFQRLVRLLAVHESAEEQIVHPEARRDAGDAVVDARLHEESEAKHVLSDLYDLGVDAPGFDAKFAELERAVLDHAAQEERDEFPQLRSHTDPAKLRRMGGAVRAAETIAPTRPHPAAGESAAGNLVLGPPVALFDKARDAVRDWRQSRDR
jgi:hemerythrin superfamily protein